MADHTPKAKIQQASDQKKKTRYNGGARAGCMCVKACLEPKLHKLLHRVSHASASVNEQFTGKYANAYHSPSPLQKQKHCSFRPGAGDLSEIEAPLSV